MREETIRVEAFSDGVFAIAITLLILDIRVPHGLPPGALRNALGHLWPSFIAFAASFFTIGVMWMNHHRLFTVIGRTDERLLVTNGLLLFGVSFVPFPTALLAEYMTHPDGWLAAVLYNSTFLYCALMFNLLWRDASKKRRLIEEDAEEESLEAITKQYRMGPIMYILFLIFASFHPVATLAVHLGAATYFAIPPHWFHRY
jgi:uncharacterized membrane protein